jgi:uncharacterized protein (TIGR00369 family)
MSVMQPADIQASMAGSPFIAFLGLEVVSVDEASGAIECRCAVQPAFERLAGSGQWHGGVLASLIDTVGDYAVARAVGGPVPTVNFRTDYLKPAVGGQLLLRGIPRRIGRSMAVADVEVRNEKGDLVALGRGTYSTA